MKRRTLSLALATLAVVCSAVSLPLTWAADPSDRGLNSSALSVAGESQSDLGPLFESKVACISLNPPAGGKMLRQMNGPEVVRFIYPQKNWDLRVRKIELAKPLPLSAAPTIGGSSGGILEMTTAQLNEGNIAAQVMVQDMTQIEKWRVGLIEARYSAGTDRVYAQEAIFRFDDHTYFLLQMASPAQPLPVDKGATDKKSESAPPLNSDERAAREAFQRTLQTVSLQDPRELIKDQNLRILRSLNQFVMWDRKTLKASIRPLQLLRIRRNGKDVGWIQIDEREIRQNGNDGIQVHVFSHAEFPADPDKSATTAEEANLLARETISIPGMEGMYRPAGSDSAKMERDCDYFVAYDRSHELWSVTSGATNAAGRMSVATDLGNSDKTAKRALDPEKAREQWIEKQRHPGMEKGEQPPVAEQEDYELQVDRYSGATKTPTYKTRLVPFYLPQAMEQMIPQLMLADQPDHYIFGSYVAEQHAVIKRYVDVGHEQNINLDGERMQAVPIVERVGLEGTPTIHYVTRKGEYLASVNEDQGIVVTPSDDQTLVGIWKQFVVRPMPAPPQDEPVHAKARPAKNPDIGNLLPPPPTLPTNGQ